MKAAACIFLLAIAMAADPTTAATTDKHNRENRKLIHDYANCVISRRAQEASDAIVANADNDEIMRHYSSLIDSGCMAQTGGNVEVRFSGDLYRYALADALVNKRFVVSGETSFANRLPLAHLPFPNRAPLDAELVNIKSKRKREALEGQYSNQVDAAWLTRYGECVVRQEPEKSRLWLLTPPDRPEETSRINDLRPAFSACLREGTLKFNRLTMRGTVAINYYRLAMATPQPVAGKTP